MSDAQAITSALMKSIMDADDELNKFLDSTPPIDEVGNALVLLHELKGAISDVYSMFATRVMRVFEEQKVEDMAINGATIEVRGAADRKKWRHDELAQEVSKRIFESAIDLDTGEMLMSPQEIATKMLDFLQPSYWRVKELAKFGISADSFCDVGEYKTNIIIRKAK